MAEEKEQDNSHMLTTALLQSVGAVGKIEGVCFLIKLDYVLFILMVW